MVIYAAENFQLRKAWCEQNLPDFKMDHSGPWGSALCQKHDDRKPSLRANMETGGVKCQGCDYQGLLGEYADLCGLNKAGLPVIPSKGEKRLAESDRSMSQKLGPVVAEYVYKDGNGHNRLKVVRHQPKDFRQFSWDSDRWVAGVGTIPRILYRLPEVLAADLVCFVEGEKDADSLWKRGVAATTTPQGANSFAKVSDDELARLRGKQVIVIPDNDPPGRKYADQVCAKLSQLGCDVYRLSLTDSKDISDWLDSGPRSDDELSKLISGASKWEPSVSPATFSERIANQEGTSEAWPAPIPLEQEPKPPFPVGALPSGLREYCQSVSDSFEVPFEMVALCALVAIATAVQKRVDFESGPGEVISLNLYCLVVDVSGSGKTRVLRELEASIQNWELELNRRVKEDNEASQLVRQELEETLKRLLSTRERSEDQESELRATRAKLGDAQEKPYCEMLYCEGTPESLEPKIVDNDGRLTIWTAEGGEIFDIVGGRYNNGSSNIGILLKGFSQESGRTARQTRGTRYLHKPTLSIAMAVQPCVFDKAASNPEFVKRGLIARFLLAYPASRVGYRTFDTGPVSQALRDEFRQRLRSLLAIQVQRDSDGYPIEHRISLVAQGPAVLRDFARRVEAELKATGSLGDVPEFGARMREQVVKVAGLLHCWEHYEGPWEHCVSLESLESAIQIVTWSSEHVRMSFGRSDDTKVTRCKYLLDRIVSSPEMQIKFYLRDLNQLVKKKSWYQQQSSLVADIEHLIEHGYLKETQSPNKTGRPTKLYWVNPCLFIKNHIPTTPTTLGSIPERDRRVESVHPHNSPVTPESQTELSGAGSFGGRIRTGIQASLTPESPIPFGSNELWGQRGYEFEQRDGYEVGEI